MFGQQFKVFCGEWDQSSGLEGLRPVGTLSLHIVARDASGRVVILDGLDLLGTYCSKKIRVGEILARAARLANEQNQSDCGSGSDRPSNPSC